MIGDVLFVVPADKRKKIDALSEEGQALEFAIKEMAKRRLEAVNRMWESIRELAGGAMPEDRVCSYDSDTGEVIDGGPVASEIFKALHQRRKAKRQPPENPPTKAID